MLSNDRLSLNKTSSPIAYAQKDKRDLLKMRIFIGAAKPGDLNVLGVTLELWKSLNEDAKNTEHPKITELASIGGSSIITAMMAVRIPFEQRLKASLRLLNLCEGYGWNELSVSKLLDIRLPNNIYAIEPLLIELFGNKTFTDTHTPLALIVYNLTKSHFEVFSTLTTPQMLIRKALIIALSMPGYYNRAFYKGDEYIDASVIDRYPVRIFSTPTRGIYIQSESVSYLDVVLNAINRPTYIQTEDLIIAPEDPESFYDEFKDFRETKESGYSSKLFKYAIIAKAYLSIENRLNIS